MSEKRIGARSAWYIALAVIFAGAMWVPFYNVIEPRLLGIPFFYWFQFIWIVVTAIVTALAFKAGL